VKNKFWLALTGLAAIGIVVAVLLYPSAEIPPAANSPQSSEQPTAAVVTNSAPSTAQAPTFAAQPGPVAAVASGTEDPGKIAFQVDAAGKIVKDEKARLNLEQLYALFTPAEQQQKLQELEQNLPPAAARELAELMDRYKNYSLAQRQTFPPGGELTTVDEGLIELDGLHDLRAKYFGAQAADGFYGEEEKISRELLRLMALEKDQSLTMEEKAEKAQALYQSMPHLAAAEERGRREAAATPKP
jgi:hypothetical protein